jgi:hypothetical protein
LLGINVYSFFGKELNTLEDKLKEEICYESPQLELFDNDKIFEKLGTIVNCSEFGFASSGCV